MANYDNSRYTYAQVLAGTGYYMQDDLLRYSAGVKTMQGKLNIAGYNCGTPDGKFGSGTTTAVKNFQKSKNLTVDGKAGKGTLVALEGGSSTDSGYDNSRYTYAQVLAGTGYYMQDSKLRYSAGVKTMQEKLNKAGYNCGTPDGKFGSGTTTAVKNFQKSKNLTVDGKAGKGTLTALDAATSGGGSTGGAYSINFNTTTKKFDTNPQVVYETLANAGLSKIAIAGIMGNIHAESEYSTAWQGDQGSVGICQWLSNRKANLEAYANSISASKTDISVQVSFILQECSSTSPYTDSYAVKCLNYLKDPTTIDTVKKSADYFTALYERCYNKATWADVENACASTSTTLNK